MLVTPYYAAIFGLVLVVLSFRVIRIRQHLAVAMGDGGNYRLRRAVRVHGNFTEYVPLTLLLIYFAELAWQNALVAHALCSLLLLARLFHAYGVSQVREDLRFRVFGLAVTGGVISVSALLILVGGRQ
ncbi:MAPEG family protein [Marinobacteraceae bacterium S3BR75-40.1]